MTARPHANATSDLYRLKDACTRPRHHRPKINEIARINEIGVAHLRRISAKRRFLLRSGFEAADRSARLAAWPWSKVSACTTGPRLTTFRRATGERRSVVEHPPDVRTRVAEISRVLAHLPVLAPWRRPCALTQGCIGTEPPPVHLRHTCCKSNSNA